MISFQGGFPVVLDVLASCFFLATPERNLDDLALGSFNDPFSAIMILTLVLVDSESFFSRTMDSFGILQISLIHEESNNLTVLLAMIAISRPHMVSYRD
jgi:hypothetical protein